MHFSADPVFRLFINKNSSCSNKVDGVLPGTGRLGVITLPAHFSQYNSEVLKQNLNRHSCPVPEEGEMNSPAVLVRNQSQFRKWRTHTGCQVHEMDSRQGV